MDAILSGPGSAGGGLLIGFLIGLAVMWLGDRWYYTKDGRAKLRAANAKVEAETERLEAKANELAKRFRDLESQ